MAPGTGLRAPGALLTALLLTALPLAGQEAPGAGATHALLINGGSKPASNYLSHLNHLQEMLQVLRARGIPADRIHIFSADGEEATADLAVRDALPPEFWLLEGTRLGRRLRPRTQVTNTIWPTVTLRPARRAALERWFEEARTKLVPGDELLLFVTDHGERNEEDPDNGTISLWKEELSVRELRELLGVLAPGVRVVMVMSQCYSGTFASAMYDAPGSATVSGEVCGFFSTTRDLKAYGCYPEGRDRDRIGHAFQFIDALGRRGTTDEAHLEVLLTDSTPDVPLRTTDVYLERLVTAAADARGLSPGLLADLLLAEAWRDRAGWEPEIRLLDRIGDVFGTFSPRTLAELDYYAQQLPDLIEQMRTFADQWESALVPVKEENLRSFLAERPQWREELSEEAIKGMTVDQRKAVLPRLLPDLEAHSRSRPELRSRLDGLRDRADRAAAGLWRLEVRRAALQRMRSILISIAGRVLLEQRAEEAGGSAERGARDRAAYERLRSCEALEPGRLVAASAGGSAPGIEPFPPLAHEIDLLEEILPSWLGVRFGPVPGAMAADRQLPAGAARLLAVYPDSPASEAGLTAGDIVLGPPDRLFDAPGQLREWTMTSARRVPQPLRVLRPAVRNEQDQRFEAVLYLRPLPLEWPELPGPPQVGDLAPVLPSDLELVGSEALPDFVGRPYLLFFWATWCLPCKQAVPEVLAFSATQGIPVVAISDEEGETVEGYLEKRDGPFFERVAVDLLRKSFIAFGVSGTPTIVLVDPRGVVRHRQVGYRKETGLTVEGWIWTGS